MSRHFCCCIPVRFGVFLFSLISFLGAGLGAAIAWAALVEMEKGAIVQNVDFSNATQGQKIAAGVAGGIFTLIALTALLGFFGSIFRQRRLVKIYSASTWVLVFAQIVASGFLFYYVYSGKELFNGCEIKDSNGQEHDCRFEYKTWQKIVYTIVAVVELLINVYIASVIGRYVEQLYSEHDDEYRLAKPAHGSTYAPTYYPPQVQETQQSLLNAQHTYPYTDQAHSFGVNKV